MAGDLQRLREPWLGLAPEHDPMHTDEAAFRILEGDVLADLVGANAGTKVLRAAHCREDRSKRAPEAVTPGCTEAQAACLQLFNALWKMREAYVRCCEYINKDTNAIVLVRIDTMWSKLLYEAVPDDARLVTSSGYRMEYCSPKGRNTLPLKWDLSKGRKLVVTVGSKGRGLFDEQPPVLTIEDLEGIVGAACVLPGIKELMKIERELAFRDNGNAYFVVSFGGSRDADFVGRSLQLQASEFR